MNANYSQTKINHFFHVSSKSTSFPTPLLGPATIHNSALIFYLSLRFISNFFFFRHFLHNFDYFALILYTSRVKANELFIEFFFKVAFARVMCFLVYSRHNFEAHRPDSTMIYGEKCAEIYARLFSF